MSELAVMLRPAKVIFGDKGLGPRPQSEADWTLRDVLEAPDRRKGKNWATVKRRIRYDYGSSETSLDVILLGRADEAMMGAMDILEKVKERDEFALLTADEGKEPDTPRVTCVGGVGHPVAEDGDWEEVKEAFEAFTKKTKENKHLREWFMRKCPNGDREGLNPLKWDTSQFDRDSLSQDVSFVS